MREVDGDVAQGADMLMVKPALPYLDIVAKTRARSLLPVVAYHVSGEYAMLKAAVQNGWLDEERSVKETMISLKRAGADLIVTYYAKWIAAKTLSRDRLGFFAFQNDKGDVVVRALQLFEGQNFCDNATFEIPIDLCFPSQMFFRFLNVESPRPPSVSPSVKAITRSPSSSVTSLSPSHRFQDQADFQRYGQFHISDLNGEQRAVGTLRCKLSEHLSPHRNPAPSNTISIRF